MKRQPAKRDVRAKPPAEPARRPGAGRGVSRGEAWLLVGLLVAGAGLRLWAPEHMAVEHFDEGVYASNIWFDAEAGYQFPNRPFYAPPLMPFLIECMILLFGPQGVAPFLPNLLAGWATIALLWLTARLWFGPLAGISAAAFAAFSEIHILFSRTALTDVFLCCWILLAVGLAERALRRGRLALAIAAGMAAGLAWWTKYNGWLAAGIALGGGACWAVLERRTWRDVRSAAILGSVIATAALVVWLPVLAGLQRLAGGYGAVLATQAKYVVGPAGWLTAAQTQIAALRALEGAWSIVGLAVAAAAWASGMAGTPSSSNGQRDGRLPPTALAIVLGGALVWIGCAALLGAALTTAMLAALGLAMRLRTTLGRRSDLPESASGDPAVWLLLVWFVGLLLATPLYYPYARLTLPWLVAGWLGAGLAVHEFARAAATAPPAKVRTFGVLNRWPAALVVVAVLGAAIGGLPVLQDAEQAAWQDRSGLRAAATALLRDVENVVAPNADQRVILVYAEPALFYQLRALQGERPDGALVLAIGSLEFEAVPPETAVFLAAGLNARRSAEFLQRLRELAPRMTLTKQYPYEASDLVLADHFPPTDWRAQRSTWVSLYRLR